MAWGRMGCFVHFWEDMSDIYKHFAGNIVRVQKGVSKKWGIVRYSTKKVAGRSTFFGVCSQGGACQKCHVFHWGYEGSVPRPPCTPNVRWFVLGWRCGATRSACCGWRERHTLGGTDPKIIKHHQKSSTFHNLDEFNDDFAQFDLTFLVKYPCLAGEPQPADIKQPAA